MVQSKSQNNLIILKSTSAWTNSRMKEFIKKKMSLSAFHFSTCIHLWKISLQYDVTCCTLTCQFKLNPLHNTKKPKKKKKKKKIFFPLLLWNSATMYIAFPLLTVRWCVLICNAEVKPDKERGWKMFQSCDTVWNNYPSWQVITSWVKIWVFLKASGDKNSRFLRNMNHSIRWTLICSACVCAPLNRPTKSNWWRRSGK